METATNELTQIAGTACRFWNCFSLVLLARCGPGSSVGIATDYGLDGPVRDRIPVLSVAKGPIFGGGPVPEYRASFAWTRNRFYRSGPSIRVFTFGHHRGTGQFCGSSPTWYITVLNIGIEYRPSTVLISWGVPDGKHIKQLTGWKGMGITCRYYNLRRTSTGKTVFPLAAG